MPRNPDLPTITPALAERHEALWLELAALHKDTLALGAKKPAAPVADAVRIRAQPLLSECAPFIRQRKERLPQAAETLAGLAVQLGQALAGLDAFESQRTEWDMRWKCRVWRVKGDPIPVRRLKPDVVPPKPLTAPDGTPMREKLAKMIDNRWNAAFEQGFRAGRAARQGLPEAAGGSEAAANGEVAADHTAAYPAYPRLQALS